MFNINKSKRQASVIIAIILIPCLALAYFVFYENIRTRIEDEQKKNIELTKVTAKAMDTYFRSIKYTLDSFDKPGDGLTSQNDIIYALRNFKHTKDAERYFILNHQGIEVATFPPAANTIKIPAEWLEKTKTQGTLLELVNPLADPIKIIVLIPTHNQRQEIIGFAGVEISMQKVAQDFANIKVSNNGYVILIDRLGHVLVHPDSDLLRKRIPPQAMLHDPVFQAAIKGVPGAIDIVAPYDGKKKLFSFASMQETGWIVLLVEPENDLQVVMTKNLVRNSVVYLLVIISVFSLFLYMKSVLQRASQEEVLQAEKLALVGQLASGMAHEIRNPLTTVKGFLQLIMANETDPKKIEKQTIMLSEVERIEDIISETLLLAKPQKQKLVEFSLNSLIRQTVAELKVHYFQREVNFVLYLAPEALTVYGDPNHAKQALLNLIKNAVEASKARDVVTISSYKKGKEAIILISDNGSGIAEDVKPKVGTPFFTTKNTGTGLGILVSNRVLASMGGKLEITSKFGQGTRVFISLPLGSDPKP
ncbi:MAG: ATP-binding protein [Carboxydocellales bacterium]